MIGNSTPGRVLDEGRFQGDKNQGDKNLDI
jgi:hypothetical protein